MRISLLALVALLLLSAPAHAYEVVMGNSWSGFTLQEVLDWEYGPGAVNVSDYFGSNPADPSVPYWFDSELGGLIFKEIAGFADENTMGWHVEDGSMPVIDGIDDGIIFSGEMGAGESVTIKLPREVRFGLWLDPNGPLDSHYAPQGEYFFTNRFYNDIGPNGSGADHAPYDGDPQALIFNLTPMNYGIPTFVVAWEDLDYGSPITLDYDPLGTDNDFTDLVVEIQAFSPVPNKTTSFGRVKALYKH